ncbi:hypothetical protein MP228_002389 [Amoeboaphelidium protococcarum]|nr:hypothetical protein MP228_002389 [Amoeboaphelidium protococcarum]
MSAQQSSKQMQNQNNSVQSVDIQALVVEVGSSSFRIGYSGEDTPRLVIPTAVGVVDSGMESQYFYGDQANQFRENMEVRKVVVNGKVVEWELYEKLWEYAIKQMRVTISEYPVLVVERSDNSADERQKVADLLIKQYQVPAIYFARSAVMAAFAAGRSSGLVIDVGADLTTITPVYEGYVLTKGAVHQDLAGNAINTRIYEHLTSELQLNLTPRFKIEKKKALVVDVRTKPDLTLKKLNGVTESFEHHEKMRIVEDFKQSVCAVSAARYDPQLLAMRPTTSYEFPDGYNSTFGAERFKFGEMLFQPKVLATSHHHGDASGHHDNDGIEFQGVATLVYNSLNACDQDVRPQLLSHVIVVGGGSLLDQFAERLSVELGQLIPGLRIKIYASGNRVERRFGNWIGGSILSSLGTFQSMWVARSEYEDGGMTVVDKKCP